MDTVVVIEEAIERVDGVIGALPSKYLSFYAATISGLYGVRVEGVDPRSTLMRLFIRAARRIGLSIDTSGESLRAGEGGERVRATVNVYCEPLLLYSIAVLASTKVKPGSLVVLRSTCPELRDRAKRLAAALSALGVRAWPSTGDNVLAVEAPPRLRVPGLYTLPPGSDYLLLAFMMALAGLAGRRVVLRPTTPLPTISRVLQVAEILESLGLEVSVSHSLVTVSPGERSGEVVVNVAKGYVETGIVASLSRRGRLEVEGLPKTLYGEEQLLDIYRAIGYELSWLNDRLVLMGGEPRHGLVGVRETPQLLLPVIAAAVASRTEIGVAGYRLGSVEEPRLERLSAILGLAGFTAEEKGATLIIRPGNGAAREIDCTREAQGLCIPVFTGLLVSTTSRVVFRGLDLEYFSSRLPGILYSLGASIREKR